MNPELRRVKIARNMSEETTAFTAQLWVDGEHIADLRNDGRGGNNDILHLFDDKGLNTRPQVAAFEAWCEGQPSTVVAVNDAPGAETFTVDMNADYYITLMLENYEEEQQLRRWCRTKTVIRLNAAAPGSYVQYKAPYSLEFAARIRVQEPDLAEILNERYI